MLGFLEANCWASLDISVAVSGTTWLPTTGSPAALAAVCRFLSSWISATLVVVITTDLGLATPASLVLPKFTIGVASSGSTTPPAKTYCWVGCTTVASTA